MSKFKLFTQSSVIITRGLGFLQALVIYPRVKEEKAFPSMLEVIIVVESVRGRIHPITSTQGKSSGHVATFVIADFLMFAYKGISSQPTSLTVLSLIM